MLETENKVVMKDSVISLLRIKEINYQTIIGAQDQKYSILENHTKKVELNLKKEKIIDVWEKKIFHEVRKSLLKGDRSHSPCNECDVDGLLSGNEFAKKWGEFYEKS